jgi:hypothetical protein
MTDNSFLSQHFASMQFHPLRTKTLAPTGLLLNYDIRVKVMPCHRCGGPNPKEGAGGASSKCEQGKVNRQMFSILLQRDTDDRICSFCIVILSQYRIFPPLDEKPAVTWKIMGYRRHLTIHADSSISPGRPFGTLPRICSIASVDSCITDGGAGVGIAGPLVKTRLRRGQLAV